MNVPPVLEAYAPHPSTLRRRYPEERTARGDNSSKRSDVTGIEYSEDSPAWILELTPEAEEVLREGR